MPAVPKLCPGDEDEYDVRGKERGSRDNNDCVVMLAISMCHRMIWPQATYTLHIQVVSTTWYTGAESTKVILQCQPFRRIVRLHAPDQWDNLSGEVVGVTCLRVHDKAVRVRVSVFTLRQRIEWPTRLTHIGAKDRVKTSIPRSLLRLNMYARRAEKTESRGALGIRTQEE